MSPRAKAHSEFANAVDRQLERYRTMRDFHVTAEPQGGSSGRSIPGSGPFPFVVQKHAATRLHYDFRLGWRGVLKSWAVTKGPSYFPGDKRLAVEVEDHPMEYGGFEGTIPKGQYGGGTVMIWDFGEWKGLGDVDRELEKGSLKFELNGTKLKGKWALVRMRRNLEKSEKPNWLLIKENDEYAQPESAPAVTDEAPNSAVTRRTIEQIAESKDHIWDSRQGLLVTANGAEQSTSPPRVQAVVERSRKRLERIVGSIPRETMPGFVAPQLAQQALKAPDGRPWIHELKLDGYRIQVHVQAGKNRGSVREAKLFTRTGLDWTSRMPNLARAASALNVDSCILDGEIVAVDQEGRTSFSDLQAAFQQGRQGDLLYFAFDLLHLNGRNLRSLALSQRKAVLAELSSQIDPGTPFRLSEHIEGRGSEVFAKACELGAEGVVSKLASAPYTSGRGNTWLKVKCALQQEFVIGGFTLPEKGGRGIGALLLGYYDSGKLLYAGRCGTGFSEQTHHELRDRLEKLREKNPGFARTPQQARHKVQWVKPELVAQIAFAAWTKDDLVRQASFKGLREDKPPREVIREAPPAGQPCPDSPVDREKSGTARRAGNAAMGTLSGFRITHPEKVIDPDSGVTKHQLAEYYLEVADHILPHIADRPLSVVRCPDGIGKPCFFQKHVSAGLPSGVNHVSIANRKTGKKEEFLTLNTVEGLVGLAQLGVLEIHPWGSKNDALEKPDRIIFDLDPDQQVLWTRLASAASELRDRLKKLKLSSFLKSTGGKGLHVVVPVRAEYTWPTIKQFSHAVVLQMEKAQSGLYITTMTKASRTNKIYLDYLRNDREATAIAPFSTRARSGVPVAVTMDWKELESSKAPRFAVSDIPRWRNRLVRDPWKAMAKSDQHLTREALHAVGIKVD
jgi:bifunctional non-homologous end joining protein LigD